MTHANPAPAPAIAVSREASAQHDKSLQETPSQSDGNRNAESLKRIELRATEEFVAALDALAQKDNSSKADIFLWRLGLLPLPFPFETP